jgi:hypothetical protein
MTLGLILLLGLAPPVGSPQLPPAANVAVHQAFTQVKEALSAKDFALAQTRSDFLPKRVFTITWDDSNVPAGERDDFAKMRDYAIQAWKRVYGLDPKIGADGDVLIKFADRLPNGPQRIPSSAVWEFGTHPRLTFTIGLKRGSDLEALSPPAAYVQVARAIGCYLGLADEPLPGSAMWLDDKPVVRPYGPTEHDMFEAQTILSLCDELKRDASAQVSVPAGEPALSLSPGSVQLAPVRQGTQEPVELTVSNRGTAPLSYQVVPDCGCFSQVPPGQVGPGQTVKLKTIINTTVWVGTQHKGLVFYSNDPQNPSIPIPVEFTSLPAYRLYRPEGDTVIVPNAGTTFNVLLTLPGDSTIVPTQYEVIGMPAQVTMTKWSGTVADPDLDDPARPREGFKFAITVPGKLPVGRTPLNLSVSTGDKQFPLLQYSLYLQKGIVALPDNVFWGDMSAPGVASFRLSRHGKPFLVTGIEDAPNLTAKIKPILGETEYQVDVSYDGRAPKGDFEEVIRVKTNDPNQPVIDVPFSGTVR